VERFLRIIFFRWADQFDSGNALVKRDVFKRIGLFDLNFNKQSMGDGEFGIRAYVNGVKSISNPYAKRIHLKVSSGGLREIGHWDGFRPKKWFAPKPLPSVVYLYKKYYPEVLSRNAILLGIMLSNVGYKNKRKNNMLLLSMFLTIVKAPLLYIQYIKSKSRAEAILKGGDKIETLN
jgi:GT2 family glycosyltransferase